MRTAGAGLARCFWFSVLSSLPQPIVALPALYLTAHFIVLLPWGLGFASGAMLFVALHELIPEAISETGGRRTSLGGTLGFAAMLICTFSLDHYL